MTAPGATNPESAVASGRSFGLYDAAAFELVDAPPADVPLAPPRWYFSRETIAVPRGDQPVATFAPRLRAIDDVREWANGTAGSDDAMPALPPLVWAAAPQVLRDARLDAAAETIRLDDGTGFEFALVPRHPLNRSYFDASSARFFAQRPLCVRGTVDGRKFTARTLWPQDFRLDADPPPSFFPDDVPLALRLRLLIAAGPIDGARAPFVTRTLWRRDARSDAPAIVPGRPVIALLLNGAQGDDDEAHGGHFALVTGRARPDGAIGDWLVSNFYSLDLESEKGIIAAPVPLDNYLADLNSGQAYYRPSWLLVITLRRARAAALLQGALNRYYLQLYRHQIVYQHATMNCAGISVDVLRALGWPIHARGPASPRIGAIGFPWFLATERSLAKARATVDYLSEDQTRLMPAAAFEEIGASALALAGGAAPDGRLARLVAEDAESIAWIGIPQLPSSRAVGDTPVVTPAQYRKRLPREPQVVPVPPRPFPPELRDPDLLRPPRRPSFWVALGWAAIACSIIVFALAWLTGRGGRPATIGRIDPDASIGNTPLGAAEPRGSRFVARRDESPRNSAHVSHVGRNGIRD